MNRPIIIYSVIGLCLLLVWFFAAYAPQHIQHEKLQTQLTEARAKLADYHNTLVELQAITKTRDELSIEKNKLNSILYTKHNILNLFEHLEEQLSSKNLSLKEITPPISELLELNANVGDTSKPQFLTIMLRVEGNYINFGRFVSNLEKSDYFRGVKRCQITNPPDEKEYTQFMIQFRALLGSFGTKS
jgi:Tfp pilus assembly protein PilO